MSQYLSKKRMKKYLWELLIIFLGSTMVSFAVKYIFDPAGLITGGVSGLAIIIRFLTQNYGPVTIPLWLSNLMLNVPVFIFAWKVDGFKRIVRTGVGFLIMTAELAVFPDYPLIPDNLLLTSVYGGILFGVGTGLLLLAKATTGGTDMLGNSLQHFFRHIPVGTLIEILDGSVVVLGAFVFNIEHTLYAIISVYVMGKLIDKVVDRGKKAKIALIISRESSAIAGDIMMNLDRGVTSLDGKGVYSGHGRTVLVCVCTKKDIPEMKDIVKEHDKKAFFIVGNVSEAMGEGFVEHWS